jgi:hypothetical protein
MTAFSTFSISTSSSSLFLLLIILFAAFSFYVYKYTIPIVSRGLKIILVSIRSVIFFLILFLILDPVISILHKKTIDPKTYVFIDNSNSIAAKDSIKRLSETTNFLKNISSENLIRYNLYTFGEKIDSLNTKQFEKVNFKEPQTNFAKIIDYAKINQSSMNSIVILSDGIITDGIDPTYQAEKLQIPIFTVGIGDTTQKRDVLIYNVLFNQTIYAGKQSTVEVDIKNFGFGNNSTRVTLFEENKVLESKDVLLNESGFNKILFNYEPSSGGEKKLKAIVSPLNGEYSTDNNAHIFYVNVLDTKLKICLVSGTPSADVSAIVKALSSDKNIQVKKIIQTAPGKFLNDQKPILIDSADVIFLVDFPTSNSSQDLLEKVSTAINQNKPFFFLLSTSVDLYRLNNIKEILPFSFSRLGSNLLQVQPELISGSFSSYFSSSNNKKEIWNNLPPTSQFAIELANKPGSNILVKSKVRNVLISNPLVVTKSLGKQRAFTILCSDIWKWQLQTAEKNPEFFDNFINDIVKWLSVSSQQKQFSVHTEKKMFSSGEQVEIKAELYDQTFVPIDTAKIELQLTQGEKKIDLTLSPLGNGIYTTEFTPITIGDYSFEGTAHINNNIIKSTLGRLTVGEIQIEKIDTRMRADFLKLLARSSVGEYYSLENSSLLIKKLRDINQKSIKQLDIKNEFQLFSQWWILAMIIILFSFEWFIRKRSGMI